MSEAAAQTGPEVASEACDALDEALKASGPEAVLDRLVRHLDGRGEYRALLGALLLKARYELGLPLVQAGGLNDLPEPARGSYEERYVAAVREVGRKLLDSGDVPGAWPYFRAIGEPEPVARAIEAFEPDGDDERLGAMVEVAFNQGANPRRGFELILSHYGTCSAITAFEHLPRDEATRASCTEKLARQLHEHLVANLRADIAQRGQPLPAEGAGIPALIADRDWLFADDAYHIDVSHLASVVRLSPLLTDPDSIALAVELTDYGRKLSGRHVYEGDPPFEHTYDDHGVYLRALLGQDVDAAVAHFRAKLEAPPEPEENPEFEGEARPDPIPAQVMVGLLARLGRLDEAIGVAAEHLSGYPESALGCPGMTQLCQRAGRPDRLAEIARAQGDLVNYATAILQRSASPTQ
jgi:hypothetical protein